MSREGGREVGRGRGSEKGNEEGRVERAQLNIEPLEIWSSERTTRQAGIQVKFGHAALRGINKFLIAIFISYEIFVPQS